MYTLSVGLHGLEEDKDNVWFVRVHWDVFLVAWSAKDVENLSFDLELLKLDSSVKFSSFFFLHQIALLVIFAAF